MSVSTIDQSIADRVAAVARAHPQRPAVSWLGQQLTYEILAQLMDRTARQLLDAGVLGGDRVALLFDRGVAPVWALLGVLRSGAIAVPLLPSHPAARLRQVVDNCSPRLVITEPRHAQTATGLSGGKAAVLETDGGGGSSAAAPAWPAVAGGDPALILYTSGTSGQPKGVVQTHRNINWKVDANARAFETTPADRVAFLSTYAVAQGVTTMFCALLYGAELCPFDVRQDGLSTLTDWLVRERISIFVSSATVFRTMAGTLGPNCQFPDLRVMRIGGERVTPDDVAAHRRLFAGSRLLVSYSSTEAGSIAMQFVEPDEAFPDGIVPVGRPVDGVAVRLRDEHGGDIVPGGTGEIVVESAYLSTGYWGDPEGTAAAFTLLPGTAGLREYRTGDLGRMRGGRLEHLGRTQSRVKIRGSRVELEEVEAALARCPDVIRAVVVARPQSDGNDRLIAYIQPRSGCAPTGDTLRAALGRTLPDYSIPSIFVMVDALPLTESGKPDPARLPDPPADRPVLSTQWAAPRTSLEAAIGAIWRDVLGLQRIGVHDAFLSVGGDSLKATQIASRLSKALGVDLSIGRLLEASTIADMAILVNQTMDEKAPASG